MMDLFTKEYKTMKQLQKDVERQASYLSQGFFSKTYIIEDKILKLNCGDPDYGYISYYNFYKNIDSIHSPVCYQFKIFNFDAPHYLSLMEMLRPFDGDESGVDCLREMAKNKNISIINDYKFDVDTSKQILGCFDFISKYEFDNEFTCDICCLNIMMRGDTWVINDPVSFIRK